MKDALLPIFTRSYSWTPQTIVENKILWPLILMAEVFIYGSYGVFINMSRVSGRITFQSSSVVLCTEIIKFLLALLMLWPHIVEHGLPRLKLTTCLQFSVPALCYCLNNNLAVLMQDQMDPATYQVLCNLKIATTALLYRVIMKRRLTGLQWVSLVILTIAGGFHSYSGLKSKTTSLQDVHMTFLGLLMALFYCVISGFAGVYTEFILKKDIKTSLPLQNCCLYTFGISFNLMLWFLQADQNLSLFEGYNVYTWAIVLSQAVSGLVMSLIMKHSTNLVRLFIITSAIPFATFFSVIIFNLQPDINFFIVAILVILAIYIYNMPQTKMGWFLFI